VGAILIIMQNLQQKKQTRAVEMYIGFGDDIGTWNTEYVNIPVDTPEDKIVEVAKEQLKADGCQFTFTGVYSIPALDNQPYDTVDPLKSVFVTDIQWDTDDQKVNLPKSIVVLVPEDTHNTELIDAVVNAASDEKGYCIKSCSIPELDAGNNQSTKIILVAFDYQFFSNTSKSILVNSPESYCKSIIEFKKEVPYTNWHYKIFVDGDYDKVWLKYLLGDDYNNVI